MKLTLTITAAMMAATVAAAWGSDSKSCGPFVFGDLPLHEQVRQHAECAQKENKDSIGKYYCYTTHTVGIEEHLNGDVKSGNFKPLDEKFIVELKAVDIKDKLLHCRLLREKMLGFDPLSHTNSCAENFKLELKSSTHSPTFRGSHGTFHFPQFMGGSFELNKDGRFVYDNRAWEFGTYILSIGRCEKFDE